MKDKKVLDFLIQNEKKVNIKISRIFPWCFFACIPLIAGKALGVFNYMSYLRLVAFGLVVLFFSMIFIFLAKYHSEKSGTKYAGLLFVEIVVILLTLDPGFSIFVSYVLVPLLSCLYFCPVFSLHMSVISYVLMIVSILLRGLYIDSAYDYKIGFEEWTKAYCLGLTIEFVLNVFITYTIARCARETLVAVHMANQKVVNIQSGLISSLVNLIESKDHTTGSHVKRTSEYVQLICCKLKKAGYYTDELNLRQIDLMMTAAPLHDIGKISIPDSILGKPGRLTPEEFAVIQNHPLDGYQIIVKNMELIEDTEYKDTAQFMALFHHEHWDGSGYPFRLVEDEIPLSARIMTAADVLDALLSERPYKKPYTLRESMDIISILGGNCLDPFIVKVLLDSEDEIQRIHDATCGKTADAK